MIKYRGLKIITKEIISFDYFVTMYRGTLILYLNSNMSKEEKSKILHKSIKKVLKTKV